MILLLELICLNKMMQLFPKLTNNAIMYRLLLCFLLGRFVLTVLIDQLSFVNEVVIQDFCTVGKCIMFTVWSS